jgi:hypothetical protein
MQPEFFQKPSTLTINNLDEFEVLQRIFAIFSCPVEFCSNVVGEQPFQHSPNNMFHLLATYETQPVFLKYKNNNQIST